MTFSLKSLAKQINRLKERERKLMLITSLALVLAVFLLVVWRPQVLNWQARVSSIGDINSQITAFQSQAEQVKLTAQKDPNKPLQDQITSLKLALEQQQLNISSITSALVVPEQMSNVLGQLLSTSKLRLEKMHNQSAQPVEIAGQEKDVTLLYQHGLFFKMTGQYDAMLTYIQEIEKQDWKLYWDELDFSTTQYPNGVLQIRVHTLSTSEYVLGI